MCISSPRKAWSDWLRNIDMKKIIIILAAFLCAVSCSQIYCMNKKLSCNNDDGKKEMATMFKSIEPQNQNNNQIISITPIKYRTYMRRLSDTQLKREYQEEEQRNRILDDCQCDLAKMCIATCGISVIIILLILSKIVHS